MLILSISRRNKDKIGADSGFIGSRFYNEPFNDNIVRLGGLDS